MLQGAAALALLACLSSPALAAPPEAAEVAGPPRRAAGKARRPRVPGGSGSRSLHLGVRATGTHVEGTDRDRGAVGALLHSENLSVFAFDDGATMRTRADFALGGSSAGFEGRVGYGFAAGVRSDFANDHGILVRVGFDGEAFGNGALYHAFVAIPEVHVGYQVDLRRAFLELAATGAFVADGRYSAGNEGRRDLGPSAAAGAIGLVHVGRFRLSLSHRAFFVQDLRPGTVASSTASFCAALGRLAGCAGAQLLRGDVEVPGVGLTRATSSYGGLSVGVGLVEVGPIADR